MQDQEEQWVQSASGFWMPNRHFSEQPGAQNVPPDPESLRDWNMYSASAFWMPKLQRQPRKLHFSEEQQTAPKVQPSPEPVRDWNAYWKTRGQAWRWEPEIDQERQQFLLKRLEVECDEEQDLLRFQDIPLNRADIEWLVGGEQRNALDLREAILNDVDLHSLSLKGADFWSAELKGADFWSAKLKGANFWSAKLEGANFRSAELQGADFRSAELQGADFGSAELQGADFGSAELTGADFGFAKLTGADFGSAELKGADLRKAHLEKCDFEGARLADLQGVGPRVADAVGWETLYLAAIEWSQVRVLGDEVEAHKKHGAAGKKKKKQGRLEGYSAATRAYRQLATALEGQGLKEEAERFAYRAQVMQRKVWWWSLWQDRGQQQSWCRFLGERKNVLGVYLFSLLLSLLTGYGYRFGRSLVSYLCVLVGFAVLYVQLSQNVPPHSNIPDHLSWLDACILSVSDMVGRGFFPQDMILNEPYAKWSVLEGMIGVFMDVLLISTLTQRLFKK